MVDALCKQENKLKLQSLEMERHLILYLIAPCHTYYRKIKLIAEKEPHYADGSKCKTCNIALVVEQNK